MIAIFLTAILGQTQPNVCGPSYSEITRFAGGSISGGMSAEGSCTESIQDAVCYDIWGPQGRTLPTDAVVKSTRLYAQSASPVATVNTGGAALQLHGGLGVRRGVFNFASCVGGDTITITTTSETSTAPDIANVGTAGVNFACGASNSEFATNVAAWATTILGVEACANVAGCTKFAGVNGTAYFWRDSDRGSQKIGLATSRAANVAYTQGANGPINLTGTSLNCGDGGCSLNQFSSWIANGTQTLTLGSAGGSMAILPSTNYLAIASAAMLGANALDLTAGTMTAANTGDYRCAVHRYNWTNAMVVALGAVGTGNIAVATLPARTIVKNGYVVITTPDTSANALTVSLGRTGAAYVDYIAASDAKAAANTVYGDVVGERGANLTGYDLPAYAATTVVNAQFIKAVTNLDTVTGSTGAVYLETCLLP